jgi:hypothetical protein
MRERLRKFSLWLHPDKTRLIEFGRFAAQNRDRRGLGKPETFKLPGFVLISGKSRQGDCHAGSYAGAVRGPTWCGSGWRNWLTSFSRSPVFCIPGRVCGLPSGHPR